MSAPAITMINLCNLSYNTPTDIATEVNNFNNALNVVWGPVEYTPSDAHESVSLIYIVQGPITSTSNNEYTVVIRGTNFTSWDSWKNEDFAIATTVNFNTIVAAAPSTAVVSQGTATGLGYLINNSNDSNGVPPQAFLAGLASIDFLNVTGHSLGGTLTPPYFACICNYLFPKASLPLSNCQPFSFAGLTAGNTAFNSYFQSFIPASLNWRHVNPLDMAPNCWWSLPNIENLYVPYEKWDRPLLNWGFPEADFLENLFTEGDPNNYEQPDGAVTLAAAFYDHLPDLTWTSQALHQHHSGTYIDLVTAYYGGD
jgi:hypothetical protein